MPQTETALDIVIDAALCRSYELTGSDMRVVQDACGELRRIVEAQPIPTQVLVTLPERNTETLDKIAAIADDIMSLDDTDSAGGDAEDIRALCEVLRDELARKPQILVQGVALPYGNPRVMHRDAPNDMWSPGYTTGADPHKAERFWVGEY